MAHRGVPCGRGRPGHRPVLPLDVAVLLILVGVSGSWSAVAARTGRPSRYPGAVARSHNARLFAAALWAFCLLAATAAQPGDAGDPVVKTAPLAAVGLLSVTFDAAILPPGAADELHLSSSGVPLRVLVLAAVLAALVALPTVLRRTSSTGSRGEQPLRSRRYAIALRAPPLRLA